MVRNHHSASFHSGRKENEMGNYRIDPKKQFSKRLARWTAVFWFFYMTWLSAIVIIRPEAALYCVYMAIIVTVVMCLNVYTYTQNSIAEKLAYTLLDKTRIELNIGNKGKEGGAYEEGMTEEGGGNG